MADNKDAVDAGRPLFAEFGETRPDLPPLEIEVRHARPEDAAAIAALDAARTGADPTEVQSHVARELEAIAAGDGRRRCHVAVAGDRVVGYARTGWREYAESAEARNVPSSWYLTGLVVSPGSRRRGVGLALTRRRVEELQDLGADEVWFFSNAGNRPSIALHEKLGFEEVTRDFAVPGVHFRGGVGVLFRLRLGP